MHQPLLLDSQIRDFVFIPLIIMIFFIGILRYSGRDLMMGKSAKIPDPIEISKQTIEKASEVLDIGKLQENIDGDGPHNNALARSAFLRNNCNYLPSQSIVLRKAYF